MTGTPRRCVLLCLTLGLAVGVPLASQEQLRWYRGNLHGHSLWSDGDDYPEVILAWYKDRGYHFAVLSDHNVIPRGPKWVHPAQSANGFERLAAYRERFGQDWVEVEERSGQLAVRLKTIDEWRHLLEEPGRFLVIEGEEISDRVDGERVHVNVTNPQELVPPQGGESVLEVLQNTIDAVLEQRRRTGRPMFPHVNHPNYYWSVGVEDLVALRGERFFEVYNGHPAVHNEGDDQHPSTDRMWDLVLTERLSTGRPPLFGLAVDDAHYYSRFDTEVASPGRGWVMVRAAELSVDALVAALQAGEFYSSSGVELEELSTEGGRIAYRIRAEEGVRYRTLFIGSRKSAGPEEAGAVLEVVEGAAGSYRLRGDELYVRARIESSKPMPNPYREGELERAWLQPIVP